VCREVVRLQRTVAGIVGEKGSIVFSVESSDTVYRALEVMAEENVGSVLVIDDGALIGILSERDYSRKIILLDRGSRETAVAEIMTAKLITVEPATTVTACMELMTDKRVRHLPVLEDGELIGLISIGDVVKAVIADQLELIDQLEHYITG
jgi:CBS domain-containing protein